jgi:deoxyribonuclease-4
MPCKCCGAHIPIKDTIYETLQYIDGKKTKCCQIFLGGPQRYETRTVSAEDATKSREYLERMDGKMYVHAPYVINLSREGDDSIVEKSRNSLQKVINTLNQISPQRTGTIFHTGAKGSIENLGRQLNDMNLTVPVFAENAAETSRLGKNFEELRHLIESTDSFNLGVCIDTCHAFASGMTDFRDMSETEKLFENLSTFEDRPIMFHVNDSLVELNARKDRHAPIGFGHIWNLNRSGSTDTLVRFYELAKMSDMSIIFETPNVVSDNLEAELFNSS